MIELTKYAKIKDFYCVCYFGHSDEYLVQLRLLKPVIEREYPGLQLYIGCKDERAHLLGGDPKILKVSDLRSRRYDFAHIKELRYDGAVHPVEEFLEESGITSYRVGLPPQEVFTQKCVIVPEGNYPTRPLERRQVETLKKMLSEQGFSPVVSTDASGAGLVAGVESVALFEAAGAGVRTILVPTGVGTRLYKQMFQSGEVVHI